jgi:hypothetical protein
LKNLYQIESGGILVNSCWLCMREREDETDENEFSRIEVTC